MSPGALRDDAVGAYQAPSPLFIFGAVFGSCLQATSEGTLGLACSRLATAPLSHVHVYLLAAGVKRLMQVGSGYCYRGIIFGQIARWRPLQVGINPARSFVPLWEAA